jgi:hypothetical protein
MHSISPNFLLQLRLSASSSRLESDGRLAMTICTKGDQIPKFPVPDTTPAVAFADSLRRLGLLRSKQLKDDVTETLQLCERSDTERCIVYIERQQSRRTNGTRLTISRTDSAQQNEYM